MSHIGEKPIPLPKGVQIAIQGSQVSVKGPLGELSHVCPPEIAISQEDNQLLVSRQSDEDRIRALHGLTRSLLANMVLGVSQGFEKVIEMSGVGYRAQKSGDRATLNLGFSHPIELTPSPGITLVVEGTNRIKVRGIDKQQVGQVAADIRGLRPAEPYKGKGLHYAGEVMRHKAGKAGKAGAKRK